MEKLDKADKDMLIECVSGGVNNLEFLSKKSSTRINVYKILANDRPSARRKVQARLRKEKIRFTEKKTNLSSESITEFNRGQLIVRILYKPLRGGMTETTLNSTITELVPCLMFHNNINTNDVNKLQTELFKLKHSS